MAKLSDFGLCRLNKDEFFYSREGKLPIKWMAPESIELGRFSEKSDVWSFGVLLFEIYSLGQTPYDSVENDEILKFLQRGERLEIPESTPEWIKAIINDCWLEEPTKRSNFSTLRQQFYEAMEKDSERYGYLHFSKNYYRSEPKAEGKMQD